MQRFAVSTSLMLLGCWAHQPSVESRDDTASGVEKSPAIAHLPILPADAIELGQVTATCDAVGPRVRPARVPLATLDCSTLLLSRALDEAARTKGATAVIGLRCTRQLMADHGLPPSSLECEARAARLGPTSIRALATSTATADRTSLPAATTEFRSFVDFTPAQRMRTPGRVGIATEVPRRPSADRFLGNLRVLVTIPVARDEALKVVGVAARRLGAAHYQTPICVADSRTRGWACVAGLSAPEVDERLVAKSQ